MKKEKNNFETNSFKIVSKLFANFVKELELRIWGSSHLMKQQNLKIDPDKPDIQTEEVRVIQRELWKLIKPEN